LSEVLGLDTIFIGLRERLLDEAYDPMHDVERKATHDGSCGSDGLVLTKWCPTRFDV
jgi:hypothetical protein